MCVVCLSVCVRCNRVPFESHEISMNVLCVCVVVCLIACAR